MFKHTREAFNLILKDCKRYCNFFKIFSLIFTSLYFVYSLLSKTGIVVVNIILATLFVSYTIFELVVKNKGFKATKIVVKRSYKWINLSLKAFTLASMLYGIYTATTNVSAFSTIIATLMIILWVIQVLFELLVEILESKWDMLLSGLKKDFEPITKSVSVVSSILKTVKGKPVKKPEHESKGLKRIEKSLKEKKEIKKQERKERWSNLFKRKKAE